MYYNTLTETKGKKHYFFDYEQEKKIKCSNTFLIRIIRMILWEKIGKKDKILYRNKAKKFACYVEAFSLANLGENHSRSSVINDIWHLPYIMWNIPLYLVSTQVFLQNIYTLPSGLARYLTEVAGEGGTDCPPQKFLSSQKFRHLMG